LALPIAQVVNPNVKIIGVSVNTQHMSEDEAMDYLAKLEAETGLPTVDTFRQGAARLVDALDGI
jgi:uncharacterized NAD-dependent epimerase/dehydratase family protein